MSGADHRGKCPIAPSRIKDIAAKRTQPFALGEAQCGCDTLRVRMAQRFRAILLGNAGGSKRKVQSPLPVTAPCEAARLRKGIYGIVDITLAGEAFGERLEIGLLFTGPTAFADFAAEISDQLCARRREPSDIA